MRSTMNSSKAKTILIISLIILAVLSRFLPHWHNFTAVGAAGLFAGAMLKDKVWAFAIPLLSLWLSDLVLNNVVYGHFFDGFMWFTPGALWIYIGFALNVVVGMGMIKKVHWLQIISGAVVISMLFFLVTNFGTWINPAPPIYPTTLAGLGAAYLAGLPFFLNTLMANLLFSGAIFGAYSLITTRWVWTERPV